MKEGGREPSNFSSIMPTGSIRWSEIIEIRPRKESDLGISPASGQARNTRKPSSRPKERNPSCARCELLAGQCPRNSTRAMASVQKKLYLIATLSSSGSSQPSKGGESHSHSFAHRMSSITCAGWSVGSLARPQNSFVTVIQCPRDEYSCVSAVEAGRDHSQRKAFESNQHSLPGIGLSRSWLKLCGPSPVAGIP